MNLGMENEYTEFKKSTSELKEGVASIASILNKHGKGELFFGVTPQGDVCGQDVSEKTHSRTNILDLNQECGTVFELVDKGVSYIVRNTRRRFVMDGLGPREEIPEIPTLAVREALMNAYAHQDWTLGGCVQIDIFNDAIEILSPGWFIEGQDPDEHLFGNSASSRSRNALITRTLYRSGDIESYGTGIPRMKELCEEVGIRMEYVKSPDGTKLVFHRNDAFADFKSAKTGEKRREAASTEKLLAQMGRNDAEVYESIKEKGKVSRSLISAEFKMPDRTVLNCLKRLIEANLVISIGSGRKTEYTTVEQR